jgi:hypothetical protein
MDIRLFGGIAILPETAQFRLNPRYSRPVSMTWMMTASPSGRRNLGLPAQPRPAGATSACRRSSASMGRPDRSLDALPAIPLADLNLA